jgi:hypothetical protein
VLQTKAQALPQPLSKEVIIATKGVQHIKVKQGDVYELSIKDKDGEVLRTDFDLIAKKVGNDLEVLLEKDIIVIFDNYFEVCKIDIQSSCIISLPIKDGYHLDESSGFIDHNLQIVYSYDGERTLLNIVRNQEGVNQSDSFEQSSFNPAYLLGLLGLSGGGGGGG